MNLKPHTLHLLAGWTGALATLVLLLVLPHVARLNSHATLATLSVLALALRTLLSKTDRAQPITLASSAILGVLSSTLTFGLVI